MENNNYKCSRKDHLNVDANIFCQNCKTFLCKECEETFHSKIFSNHEIKKLNNEKELLFLGICHESNHLSKFEYFCKTHNKLCCAKCITRIKDEKNGQHSECDICKLNDIKDSKEKKFKESFDKLEDISNDLDQSINKFDLFKIETNKEKENLKSKIKNVFLKLKHLLEERENQLLLELEKEYNKIFLDEKIIKENQKLPLKLKNSSELISSIREIENEEDELSSEINYYIEFEKDLNKINEIKEKINKCYSKKINIFFQDNYKDLENEINNFGKIKIDNEPNFIKDNNFKVNPIDFIEEEFNIDIKFEKPIIENIIDIKSAKFFDVENILIINIGNNEYKSLEFYKDNDKSSKDINFHTNNRDMNLCEISVPKIFKKFQCGITLTIDNAKQDQTYEMVIYIREKGKNKNISEPLKIVVKFKKAEDPAKQKEKKANQIYEELKDEFQENINLIERDEIIAQLMKNNLNKEEIKNNLNTKIKEIEGNKIEQKIEEIYKELDFHNIPFDKNEIINIIKDKYFDKESVQDWINEKVTKELYERLKQLDDVEIDGINEAEIKEKIRELKYDFEEIKKAYLKNAGPKPYPEKVNILYQELDDDYNVGGFMDEEAAKAKIIELNCDKEACIKWIENHLLGDN